MPRWAWALIAALVGLPILVVVGLIGVVALFGTSAEERYTPVPTEDPYADPDDRLDDGLTPIPMDDDPGSADDPGPEPESMIDPATVDCPDATSVAAITGDGPLDDDPQREASAFLWNDLDLPAATCRYGQTTAVALFATDDPGAILTEVSASTGRFQVRRADVSTDARWVILPGGPDDGSVALLFEHNDQLWAVSRNGQKHDEVIALHDLVVGER